MPSKPLEAGVWWRAARKALDTWGPSPEFTIAAAIRDTHADGLRRAAQLVEERGERLLARELRKLQQETEAATVLHAGGRARN
jgi:hypothetical protein